MPLPRTFHKVSSSDVGRSRRSSRRAGLVLLGTVHSDPKGFSRTLVFLERYRPDLILVEISAFALRFRKERSFELRKIFLERLRVVSQKLKIKFDTALSHVQIASILRQISVPFEYSASYAYAKAAVVQLVPVDYSEFSRRWIETWQEMISAENIELLLEMETAGPPVSSLYAQADRRISERLLLPETPPADAICWQQREKQMADEIASALKRFSPKRPVYIGGWWHLSSGGSVKTIRELLGIETACCHLLDRATDRPGTHPETR